MRFLDSFLEAALPVDITCEIRDCRDQKDNMLLELALSGSADLILTGDRDLLALHPWRGVAILAPAAFLLQPV
jgi:putative PIN family toxin of toxin-antitoxin system